MSDTLDDAQVLFTAPATPGLTGQDHLTAEPTVISYFAIATYPEHQPRVYLFGVSVAHRVLCDFDLESPAEAMRYAQHHGFTTAAFRSPVV